MAAVEHVFVNLALAADGHKRDPAGGAARDAPGPVQEPPARRSSRGPRGYTGPPTRLWRNW